MNEDVKEFLARAIAYIIGVVIITPCVIAYYVCKIAGVESTGGAISTRRMR